MFSTFLLENFEGGRKLSYYNFYMTLKTIRVQTQKFLSFRPVSQIYLPIWQKLLYSVKEQQKSWCINLNKQDQRGQKQLNNIPFCI